MLILAKAPVATGQSFNVSPSLADSSSSAYPNDIVIATNFTASVDGTVTAIKFYKPNTALGDAVTDTNTSHSLGLWTTDGVRHVQHTTTGEPSGGWITTPITPYPIAAGTQYVVSFWAAAPTAWIWVSGVSGNLSNSPYLVINTGQYENAAGDVYPDLNVATDYWYADVVFQIGWVPSAVASLVLDADTISQADGTAVSSWVSTGSNTSYAATQSNVPQQPTLVKNVLGGRAVVRFNNANDTFLSIPSLHAGSNGLSLIVLANLSAALSYPMMLVYDTPATGFELRCNGGTGDWQWIVSGGASSVNTNTSVINVWHMIEGIYRKGDQTVAGYTDGTVESSGSNISVTLNTDAQVWLGRRTDNYAMSGDIACAIIVAADLANVDRQKIEGWMAHRWGLTANLPAGHPYKASPP